MLRDRNKSFKQASNEYYNVGSMSDEMFVQYQDLEIDNLKKKIKKLKKELDLKGSK